MDSLIQKVKLKATQKLTERYLLRGILMGFPIPTAISTPTGKLTGLPRQMVRWKEILTLTAKYSPTGLSKDLLIRRAISRETPIPTGISTPRARYSGLLKQKD